MWDKEVEKNSLEANAYSSKYHTTQEYMELVSFKKGDKNSYVSI
jgi:hypothetical protein